MKEARADHLPACLPPWNHTSQPVGWSEICARWSRVSAGRCCPLLLRCLHCVLLPRRVQHGCPRVHPRPHHPFPRRLPPAIPEGPAGEAGLRQDPRTGGGRPSPQSVAHGLLRCVL